MIEIPDIEKSGVLINTANHQPEVRKNAETARVLGLPGSYLKTLDKSEH